MQYSISDLNSKGSDSSSSTNTSPVRITSPSLNSFVNSSNQSNYPVISTCSESGANITIKAISSISSQLITATGICSAGTVTIILDLSSLAEGNIELTSTQVDSKNNTIISAIVTVFKDTIAPIISGVLTDGSYFASLSQSPVLSWGLATDTGGSGVSKYQVSIGTSSGGTQTLNWTDIGNVTSYQVSSLSLSEGVTYYPSIRAIDAAGNQSTAINGDGWITDTIAPTTITSVEDGDQIVSTSYSSWIAWPATTDAGSGVASYELRIVDNVNSAVTTWTNVGTLLGYGFTGLSLTEGHTYKAEVRAIDIAGNVSAVKQGNGWYVVPQGWKSQAYLKAPNAEANDNFGANVSIDNDTIVVGATGEDSNQTTITNGSTASSDNSLSNSGAVYVFKKTGSTWTQEAFLKASNADANDSFGNSISISGDTIAVGAYAESSSQTTITNGPTSSSDNSVFSSGAVYIYKRNGTSWAQEAYLKAPNPELGDSFGISVSISLDTVVVGAHWEDSNQTSITNGSTASADNSLFNSGAAYIFKRNGTTWAQEAYLKASNADTTDIFGQRVAIHQDTVVIGTGWEDSNQTTITNGPTASSDNSATSAGAVYVFKRTGSTWAQEAYLKASNADANDFFGQSIAISYDTIVIGAYQESSNQTTITNGATASGDNSAVNSGAAYIFKRTGNTWAQEAYLKASNADANDKFGVSVAISNNVIAVGAFQESSNQTTITNSTTASSNNSATNSGAAYIYRKNGLTWAQEAYLKAPNADASDMFGNSISISGDIVVVGAYHESSNQTTITNGSTASTDNSATNAGAAYVFNIDRLANWQQQAFVKASNSEAYDNFGYSVDIDGDTMVVGAPGEDSNQTTISSGSTASSDNSALAAGAAYIFKRTGNTWSQEAYLKASNANASDSFYSVAISGNTVVVGAMGEASNQTTISSGSTASSNNSLPYAGAAYVFVRSGNTWSQEAYLKPPVIDTNDYFGSSVAISGDTIVVGAIAEDSNQTTITNGNTASSNNSATGAGAAYVFKRNGTTWTQEAYLKPPNVDANDNFGGVAISGDTIVVGSPGEDSNQTTITNGTTASNDNSAISSGAVYVFKRTGSTWTQEAYLKPPNTRAMSMFSYASISNDTIAVGALSESSNQTFITNGNTASSDSSSGGAGAVYVFKRTGTTWAQEAYIKAPNASTNSLFGAVKISGDYIVVGSRQESANQTTITNGTTANNNFTLANSGSVYVFKRTGTTWAQEAYIKAPNAEANDQFGTNVSFSSDTIIVGSTNEDSIDNFITNGSTASSDNSASASGAVYIFKK